MYFVVKNRPHYVSNNFNTYGPKSIIFVYVKAGVFVYNWRLAEDIG